MGWFSRPSWLSVALCTALLACSCHAPSRNTGTPTSTSPTPAPAPTGLCAEVGGTWNAPAEQCALSKSGANGVHVDVKAGYPADLINDPTAGPVLGPFVRKFFADYADQGQTDTNGNGDATLAFTSLTHGSATKTVFFQADWYFSSMPHPGGQINTFTFDFNQHKQLALVDLFCPGVDPLKVIPPIARPFVKQALGAESPLRVEQFEPDQPEGELADNYQAWALDNDDLVLYMPAERGPGGVPPGSVAPHIPLADLSSVLREKGCSTATPTVSTPGPH
jgi:hypothetical protein